MKLIFLLLISIFLFSCNPSDKIIVRNDFKPFFDDYEVDGCFLLYDMQKSEYIAYNYDRCKESFLPAFTFKILNSLIGLETGIVLNVESDKEDTSLFSKSREGIIRKILKNPDLFP